jgi:type I restriction enzyme S subunit
MREAKALKAEEGITSKADPIQDNDIPFPTLLGWVWTRVGAIALQTGSGSTPRGGKSAYSDEGTPFLRSQNIYDDGLRLDDVVFINDETNEKMKRTQVKSKDLLLNITGGSIGRCTRVPDDFAGANVSQHVAIIRTAVSGTEDYLHLLVRSPFFQEYVIGEQTGAGRGGLPKNRMDRIPVPLPPIAEQHRIVAKVDELMALCDRLEEARKTREEVRDKLTAASLTRLTAPYTPEDFPAHARFALEALPSLTTRPDQIKTLRQTILNLAVRGKLVEQDAGDEPASIALNQLKDAAAKAFRDEGLRARKPVASASRQNLKFDFPEHWELPIFDDVFVMVSGVTKGGKVSPQDAQVRPYLRVANVQRGHLDLGVIKTIEVKTADADRYRLKDGDILMTEGGDWDKLGRAAIWRCQIDECIHQNHVFRVRPPSDEILPEWVITYVNSELGRSFFEDASKQTTNLASINMTQLRGCPLPLPPLAEQHRIVDKVDALMALCDRLESALATTDTTRTRLLEALLHEALEPSTGALEAAE